MNTEDKEFMEKYILNNPFEFKQGIISHCREMDKIDVYNWVAEDELKIDKLQQENKILKENAEHNNKVVDKVNWENMLLKKETKQLKDNWNELKDYISIKLYNTEYLQKLCGCRIDDIDHILLDAIREEMQELEQGSDSNV